MKTNHSRVLDAQKASQVIVVQGIPNTNLGQNGDFAISQYRNEIKLYIKYKGAWHGIPVGRAFDVIRDKIDSMPKPSGPRNKIQIATDKIISDGDFVIDAGVTSLIGTLKIKEQADASADTAAYGQIWVDTATPNELAFTDDAGTDIIGVGKYHYESKIANYSASVVANYIPLVGYVVERTSTAGQNEYIAMVAPYNGTIEKILWRSEESQDGLLAIAIYESADETEVPGSVSGSILVTVDRINDDVTVDASLASMDSGTNALVKGRIYAIKITSPSAPNDTNCTVVFKWDITS